MKKTVSLLCLCAALMGFAPSSASGAVVFHESFEYDTSTSNSLEGRNGGVGFTGSWNTSVGSSNLYLTPGGLSYQVAGGGLIDGGNTALRYNGDGQTYTNLFNRSFESYSGNELYVSFLFEIPEGSTLSPTRSTGIWLNNDNNWIYNYNNPNTNSSFGARIGGSTTDYPEGPIPTPGTTYFVVARISKSNSGEGNVFNKIELWLNPGVDGWQETPLFTAVATGPTGAVSAYDLLGYRTNLFAGNSIVLDHIIGGSTWADVVPGAIPEPGTGMLAGLAFLAAVLKRSRKKGR